MTAEKLWSPGTSDVPRVYKSIGIDTVGGEKMQYKNGKLYKFVVDGIEIEFSVENLTKKTVETFNRTLAEIAVERRKKKYIYGQSVA